MIWKSEGVSFNQAIKELKDFFELVDNYITETNVNSHFENVSTPKKMNQTWLILSHLIQKHITLIEQDHMCFVFID